MSHCWYCHRPEDRGKYEWNRGLSTSLLGVIKSRHSGEVGESIQFKLISARKYKGEIIFKAKRIDEKQPFYFTVDPEDEMLANIWIANRRKERRKKK